MKHRHMDFSVWKTGITKSGTMTLQPEFALIHAVIEARTRRGLTQTELANA